MPNLARIMDQTAHAQGSPPQTAGTENNGKITGPFTSDSAPALISTNSTENHNRARPGPTSVRSLVDSIHDIAGTILYETGFTQVEIDRAEIVEILRFLEDCREEGRALFPEILLTTDLDKCLAGVHPPRRYLVGEFSDRPGRFRRALKKCAPITTEPWVIALEVTKSKVRFGFVSSEQRADSTPLHHEVFEARGMDETPLPFVFLRRFGTRAVWIKSLKAEQIISLTLSDELLRASEHVNAFANIATENLSQSARESTARVITRLVQEACREGHGFIACIVRDDGDAIDQSKKVLVDGSWLEPRLSLSTIGDPINDAPTLESDSELRAKVALARRMIEMDLMTMFSTAAQIVGYNIHIPYSPNQHSSGGARTKAFATLKNINSLRAALMCSQDGQTYFEEFRNANKR